MGEVRPGSCPSQGRETARVKAGQLRGSRAGSFAKHGRENALFARGKPGHMREARQVECARQCRADTPVKAGQVLEARQGKAEACHSRCAMPGKTYAQWKAGHKIGKA
jgi:hypothetical protein